MPRRAEKQNAKDYAKVYRAKIIEQGVCQYDDETILVKNEALHKMTSSFKGRPVIIMHDSTVVPENMEEKADGYVTNCYYNDFNGDFWVEFVVFTDKGKKAIDEDGYVSCAYVPTEFSQGGTWHNVSYNREILNGQYTHLAIVADPRYEDARIYENSKKKEKKSMFKMFRTKKEELQNSNDAVVELEDGVTVPLETLVESFKSAKAKKNEKEEEKEEQKMNMEDEVEIDGKKVKIAELVKYYKSEMKNEEDKKEEKEEEKENQEDEEKKKEKEKENSNFNKLKKAKENSKDFSFSYESAADKVARGQSRYGTPNPVK